MHKVPVKDFLIGSGEPLTLITGPCVIESEAHALYTASLLAEICSKFRLNWIYKASYDKANRSSGASFRGVGLDEGLRILNKIKTEFGVPVLTDVHSAEEAKEAGAVCDVIQIPAFLCRQTDLILSAGLTPAVVNVKKGQFLAPWDMKNIVDKLLSVGKDKILLTERGTSFGYHNLVSDMRSIPIMQSFGFPICFDASHSVQLPGGLGSSSGGQREFIPTLAKAAIAVGAQSLFLESHPDPIHAKSDKETVFPIEELPELLEELLQIYEVVQGYAKTHITA